jgi:predicted DCC family thiol-disulfide oxidoreductase YuxK
MSATILFDGVCNFCNSSVNYVIAHDPGGYFKFAALQSEAGERLTREYGIDTSSVDSVVLVENGRSYVRSAAALRIARKLSGPAKLLYIFMIVPRPLRDLFYDAFAKRRYKFFGSRDECMLPTPEIRARFL